MILSQSEILPLVTGIVRGYEGERGLELHRFSEKQEEFFSKPDPLFPDPFYDGYFERNCRSLTGVTVDFVTDADTVVFTFGGNECVNGSAVQKNDLFVNGKPARTADAGEEIRITFRKKELRRLTLYLAYFNRPYLSSVTLDGADTCRPYFTHGADILFMGDSITHGVGAVHPAHIMPAYVARRLDAHILNQANSGYIYNVGTLEKVCSPRLIVLTYGYNDRWKRTPEAIRNDTAVYVHRVRELWGDTPTAAVLPVYSVGEEDKEIFARYLSLNALLREAYEEAGITVIDGSPFIPHNAARYLVDGTHPNDAGYAYYGRRLADKLLETGLYR